MMFEYASCGFHYGAIIAIDVAIRKSLFVTAGADKFIRVWNYVTMAQEAAKEEDEDIFCISFHPTGTARSY
jgi:WD40 repeat protein